MSTYVVSYDYGVPRPYEWCYVCLQLSATVTPALRIDWQQGIDIVGAKRTCDQCGLKHCTWWG